MTDVNTSIAAKARRQNPGLKFALELGPTGVFFITLYKFDIFAATAVLMVAAVVSLAVSYWLTRRLPVMPIVTAAAALVFGTLTLVLHDSTFIKLKPTIVNAIFGAALLGGLAFGKPLLPIVLDSMLRLDHQGWKKLTLRWGMFFFVLAATNEVVWRTQTDAVWAGFKFFGSPALTFFFAMSQIPLIIRHEPKTETLES